jgi:hypothetical protein
MFNCGTPKTQQLRWAQGGFKAKLNSFYCGTVRDALLMTSKGFTLTMNTSHPVVDRVAISIIQNPQQHERWFGGGKPVLRNEEMSKGFGPVWSQAFRLALLMGPKRFAITEDMQVWYGIKS